MILIFLLLFCSHPHILAPSVDGTGLRAKRFSGSNTFVVTSASTTPTSSINSVIGLTGMTETPDTPVVTDTTDRAGMTSMTDNAGKIDMAETAETTDTEAVRDTTDMVGMTAMTDIAGTRDMAETTETTDATAMTDTTGMTGIVGTSSMTDMYNMTDMASMTDMTDPIITATTRTSATIPTSPAVSTSSPTWNILFNSSSELQLKKNQELAVIQKLGKEWLVSFEIKPTQYRLFGLAFQMTTNGKVGQYGDNTPAIWLHRTKGVFVSSAVNGNGNFGKYFLPPIPEGNWTKIEVKQQQLQNSSFIYSISIDGLERFLIENNQPQTFENVKIWAGDPWVDVQEGVIRNLKVMGGIEETTAEGSWEKIFNFAEEQKLKKNTHISTIKELAKEWKLSFEVKPHSYHSTISGSVLHMTIGGWGSGPASNYGDRTPAIWLHRTKGLLVSSAINRRTWFSKWIKNILPIGQSTKIEVHQVLKDWKFMFEVLINETEVFSIENEKPEVFRDVKIFASTPWGGNHWGAALNGSISQLRIETRKSGESKLHSNKSMLNESISKQ